jgi:ATP-dependent helicase/nuclease subunit A
MRSLLLEESMSSTPSLITTIVNAGAGTGKTQALATRILEVAIELYDINKKIPKIVATTFTERATSELRERVVTIFESMQKQPLWLKEFVESEEHLRVTTIHGTLSSILHKYGTHLGLDPEFSIADAASERELFESVLKEILAESSELALVLEDYTFDELIKIISKLQYHYRLHSKEFTFFKNWRDLFSLELKELLKAFRDLVSVPLEAFSEKAGEAVGRLKKIGELFELNYLNHTEDKLKIFDVKDEFLNLISEIRKPAIQAGKKGSEHKEVIDRIFYFRDLFLSDSYSKEANEKYDYVTPLILTLVATSSERIQQARIKMGVLTFDDLEFFTLKLIQEFPALSEVIQEEYDFWFVDEYQDTSPLQKKIIFQLLKSSRNAYFVGDPQQSIYLFRGADENVFQNTIREIQDSSGKLERLKINYRSHPDLLIFLNCIFSKMKAPVELLEPRSETLELEDVYLKKNRATITLLTENVASHHELDEPTVVAEKCLDLYQEGCALHDIGILVRTNDKARTIAKTLSQIGLPVFIHASGGFYEKREILDLLGLLSFIENPSNDEMFVLIARSPWVGVSDQDLSTWGLSRGKRTFWEFILENHFFENSFELSKIKSAIESLSFSPASQVLEYLVDALGLFEFCLVGDSTGRQEANLHKFFIKLKNEELKPGFLISKFLDSAWHEVNEMSEETEAASFIEPKRINILTIHKAKGLKFKSVILPFCGENPRPKSQMIETSPQGEFAVSVLSDDSEDRVSPLAHKHLRDERFKREMSEEARIFYVALTRAAESLDLIATLKSSSGKIAENSWLGQTSLDLNEGDHDANYSVIYQKSKSEMRPVLKVSKPQNLEVQIPKKIQPKLKRRFSVTEAIGVHTPVKNDSSLSQFMSRLESQQRGQAVHFIFEELKKDIHAEIKVLCDLAESKYNLKTKINPLKITEILSLHTPPLKALIEQGEVEWAFEFKEKSFTFEGQIDLWGKVEDKVWIIDYKSSKKLTPEALELAQKQLEIYALAISKTGIPWEQINLAVVAAFEGVAHILMARPKEDIIADFDSLDLLRAKNEFPLQGQQIEMSQD